MKEQKQQQGFTLLELSIVLVIIGLIVAGIVAGQSLVRQAQLRSVLSDAEGVKSSVNSFQLQYSGLPGDITNGSSYWAACGCDGNGDKSITGKVSTGFEQYEAWWELAQAGIYPGSFTPGTTDVATIGTSIPGAKLASTGIMLIAPGAGNSASGNYARFAGEVSSAAATASVLTAPEADALDAKADDGAANTGAVRGNDGATGTCLSGSDYDLAQTTNGCILDFGL